MPKLEWEKLGEDYYRAKTNLLSYSDEINCFSRPSVCIVFYIDSVYLFDKKADYWRLGYTDINGCHQKTVYYPSLQDVQKEAESWFQNEIKMLKKKIKQYEKYIKKSS